MWWVANLSDFQWTLHPSCLHIAAFIFILIHTLCNSWGTNSHSLTIRPGQSEVIISLFTGDTAPESSKYSFQTCRGNAICSRLLLGTERCKSSRWSNTQIGGDLLGIWPASTEVAPDLANLTVQVSCMANLVSVSASQRTWSDAESDADSFYYGEYWLSVWAMAVV